MADPVAIVQAWRERHAGADPVALAVVESLARRAGARQGAAREEILRRIELRLERLASNALSRPAPPDEAGGSSLDALRALVDRLGRSADRPDAASTARGVAPVPPLRTLRTVAAFQGTWTRLRAEQRLRQAAAQVPGNAGPLHSAQVLYRALRELHAISPAYLDAFLSQVEALMALEQATGGLLPRSAAPAPAESPAAPRKPARGRPRKPSGAA